MGDKLIFNRIEDSSDSNSTEFPTAQALLKITIPHRPDTTARTSAPASKGKTTLKTKLRDTALKSTKKPGHQPPAQQVLTPSWKPAVTLPSSSKQCQGSPTKPDSMGMAKRVSQSSSNALEADGSQKRKHGHPPKSPPASITRWSVSAYIEIEQPPKTIQKTPQSKQCLEAQDPICCSPIVITHDTLWSSLVHDIAWVLDIGKENLALSLLQWKVMPDACTKGQSIMDMWLPLACKHGYQDFIKNGIKQGMSCFLFHMSPLMFSQGFSVPVCVSYLTENS